MPQLQQSRVKEHEWQLKQGEIQRDVTNGAWDYRGNDKPLLVSDGFGDSGCSASDPRRCSDRSMLRGISDRPADSIVSVDDKPRQAGLIQPLLGIALCF